MPVIFVSGEHEKNLKLEAGIEANRDETFGHGGGEGGYKTVKLFIVYYLSIYKNDLQQFTMLGRFSYKMLTY